MSKTPSWQIDRKFFTPPGRATRGGGPCAEPPRFDNR